MSKNKFNLTLPPVEPDPVSTPSPGETSARSSNIAAAINSAKSLTQTSVVIPSGIEYVLTVVLYMPNEFKKRTLFTVAVAILQWEIQPLRHYNGN